MTYILLIIAATAPQRYARINLEEIYMQEIKLLVTDLDNTTYNWIDFYVPSFLAMVQELSRFTGIGEDELKASFKRLHQQHKTSEYTFAIQQLDVLREENKGRVLYPDISADDELPRRGLCPASPGRHGDGGGLRQLANSQGAGLAPATPSPFTPGPGQSLRSLSTVNPFPPARGKSFLIPSPLEGEGQDGGDSCFPLVRGERILYHTAFVF